MGDRRAVPAAVRFGLAIAIFAVLALPCAAETPVASPKPTPPKSKLRPPAKTNTPAVSGQAQPAGQKQLVRPGDNIAPPGPELIVLLVRTMLLTLNDALRSDNFTVLRDLASESFRATNTPGRLAQIFSDLQRRGVDLSAVAIITPELSVLPSFDKEKGVLHLKGYFPGQPVRIEFELLFQAERGRWALLGLSVQPVNVEAHAAQKPATAQSPPAPTPSSP